MTRIDFLTATFRTFAPIGCLAAIITATACSDNPVGPDDSRAESQTLPTSVSMPVPGSDSGTTTRSLGAPTGPRAELVTNQVNFRYTGFALGPTIATCAYPSASIGRRVTVVAPQFAGSVLTDTYGGQDVDFSAWLYRWNGASWTLVNSRSVRTRVYSSNDFKSAYVYMSAPSAGYYTVVTRIYWNPPILLGAAVSGWGYIDYSLSHASDYRANSPNSVGPGGYCRIV